jgi:ATP-binding cassette subfamily B protein
MERFGEDETVMTQGEKGDKFYVLVAGKVSVVQHNEENETRRKIAELSDGDYFGEIALLYETERNASVMTQSVCIFLTLHYEKFHQVLKTLSETKRTHLLEEARSRLSPLQLSNLPQSPRFLWNEDHENTTQ